MSEEKTKVIFRKWREKGGDVIAIFPEIPGGRYSNSCMMFEHVGQHGSGNPTGVIDRTKPAKESDYKALQSELERYYGYSLEIVHRHTRKHIEARASELRRLQA